MFSLSSSRIVFFLYSVALRPLRVGSSGRVAPSSSAWPGRGHGQEDGARSSRLVSPGASHTGRRCVSCNCRHEPEAHVSLAQAGAYASCVFRQRDVLFATKRNYTLSGTQGSFDDEWTWPLDGKTLIAWGELGFTVFTFVFWRVSSSLGAALRARGLTKTSQTLQWTAPMRCLSTLCYYATSNRLRSRIW